MTDPITRDRRPGRAAAGLGISRATARALLALDRDTRRELLDEVARVGARRMLAFSRTQPTVEHV